MLQKMAEQNEELVKEYEEIGNVSMDVTYGKEHRTACSLACHAGESGRLIGKTKGGHNTKVNATCDGWGRIFDICLTEGEASDYKGAKVLLERLPKWARRLLADMGYDADWVCNDAKSKGISPCIPGRKNRKKSIRYNKELYKQRNKIERAFAE